jgi:uncharacterized membrane protein
VTNGIRFQSVGALPILAIILLILLIIVMVPLLFLGMIGAAFTRLGLSWISALAVVLLIILGSTVNIPVYTVKREMIRMDHGGVSLDDPFNAWPRGDAWDTVISVNLGGAVIPVCLALYVLFISFPLIAAPLPLLLVPGIIAVSLVTCASTRALPGIGLQVPLLIPALSALLIGLVVTGSPGLTASVVAMASGIFGVLVGGNLAQYKKIRDLGVPAVSIGGSGTFGAMLFCCILPALVA